MTNVKALSFIVKHLKDLSESDIAKVFIDYIDSKLALLYSSIAVCRDMDEVCRLQGAIQELEELQNIIGDTNGR